MPLTSPMYGGAGRGDTDALFPVGTGNQGVQADLAFQASPFMRHTAYRKMSSLDTDMAPDGAFGKVNEAFDSGASTKMFIEEQRPGGDLILGAIANHDTAAIDRGIKILQWGFKYQNSDGSFQTEDPFHSTSFFVESTAHAMLDLQGSQYASQYQPVIQDFTQRLVKAVHWMMEPDVEAAGIHKNRIFGHRRYLVACAMGETGVLAGDQEMIKHSENYIRDGLSIQTPEGYNPERGGPDSSYNAAGLLFADQYYTMVARPEMRQPLLNMLNKGVAWEVSQVLPTGEVNTEGNTRVGCRSRRVRPSRREEACGLVDCVPMLGLL